MAYGLGEAMELGLMVPFLLDAAADSINTAREIRLKLRLRPGIAQQLLHGLSALAWLPWIRGQHASIR